MISPVSSRHRRASRNIFRHRRFREDDRLVTDANEIVDARLPENFYPIADENIAAQSGLRRNETALAELHVMGDLDHVADDGSRADDRIRQSAALDHGVVSDLDGVFDDRPTDAAKCPSTPAFGEVIQAIRADSLK